MDGNNLPVLETDLKSKTNEVVESIIKEQNFNAIKDLTNLFNLNIIKKNTLRVLKLNDLLDQVSDRMSERVEKRPDEFSNKDLMDYMSIIGTTLEKAQKNISSINEVPTITYNQQNNQVNINIADQLSRESREKITKAIEAIMERMNENSESFNINNEIMEESNNGK